MKNTQVSKFAELYKVYRSSDDYNSRKNQFEVVNVFKKIILETLNNDSLTNEHLTGLIQMFKFDCSDANFDKYLEQNISDPVRMREILEEAKRLTSPGYTNAGKTSISGLDSVKLAIVKKFLQDAFKINTIDDAIKLCTDFDKEGIPYVKSGIYSPWLYYINPKLFPILNNMHIPFRIWIGMPADYPSCIRDFNELKVLVNEEELGVLDMFAYTFEKYSDLPSGIKILDIKGRRLFKISHGYFKKNTKVKKTKISDVLEENNWIVIGKDTSKGQAKNFIDDAVIGDYVYICYGGDDLYCVGKIVSEIKPLDKQYDEMLEGGEWIYREFEPLFYASTTKLDLKDDHRFYMPSGNSTFYEVPKDQLEYLNQKMFIPNCGLMVIDKSTNKTDLSISEPTYSITHTTGENTTPPVNSILYGPPGTGKTFRSISYAVAIVEDKKVETIIDEENGNREEVKRRFDQYVEDGQIEFCTFHQSMGYEDFIEGIKPVEPSSDDDQLSYAVVDGIFKQLCTEAAFSFVQQNATSETKKVLDFSVEYDRYIDSLNESLSKENEIGIATRNNGKVFIESISQNNILHLHHKGGSARYSVSKKRLSKIASAYPYMSDITNVNYQFREVIGGCNATVYWAVLNDFRNYQTKKNSTTIKEESIKDYSDKKSIVESLEKEDYQKANSKRFVLIIDEINRGNVSQIFGELITLIEDDKRLGKKESLKAVLPYSKENFGVPRNLYVVGTMNTADRSVEALDTALRRRFSFVPMLPEPDELKVTVDGIDLVKILSVLNNRLTILKDCDHTIGHAWLWNVANVDELKIVFGDKILPLLQEYFYNDYEKLGLVLGDAFFITPHTQVNSDIFASFSGGNGLAGQYNQSWQYKLKPVKELTISDFKSLENSKEEPITDER